MPGENETKKDICELSLISFVSQAKNKTRSTLFLGNGSRCLGKGRGENTD